MIQKQAPTAPLAPLHKGKCHALEALEDPSQEQVEVGKIGREEGAWRGGESA